MQPYRTRLRQVCAARGALCIGIDPHPHLLQKWGQDLSPSGLEAVARGLVAAIGDQVAVFKPQSAFFEIFGSEGIEVLERVLEDIAQAGALSILDAKRGDIGSTMEAYAAAYLADGAPLAADALTVNPFLGIESLRPAIDAAHATGRGLYLLCRTSNKESSDVQLARRETTIAQYVVDAAREENHRSGAHALGLVIGATNAELDVDVTGFHGSILVPGVGAQGGSLADLDRLFGKNRPDALPTTSRDVMAVGPGPEELRAKVESLVAEVRAAEQAGAQ